LIGVGLVTPGEEFSCENELADQLIEQGRATLVDGQGRTSDVETAAPDTKSEDAPVVVTPKRSKATIEAEVAADEAALTTAPDETPAPESA
jgi:hypothetical protein